MVTLPKGRCLRRRYPYGSFLRLCDCAVIPRHHGLGRPYTSTTLAMFRTALPPPMCRHTDAQSMQYVPFPAQERTHHKMALRQAHSRRSHPPNTRPYGIPQKPPTRPVDQGITPSIGFVRKVG